MLHSLGEDVFDLLKILSEENSAKVWVQRKRNGSIPGITTLLISGIKRTKDLGADSSGNKILNDKEIKQI